MLAIERRNHILEKLQKEKRVVVSELSRTYQVSEETIRRDLEKLENDGLVIKSYGGAVLNEHSIFDLPFNIRKNQMVVEKQRMADLIADLVRDGEALMLDASSTAVYVARRLKSKKKLTVITNSVEIIVELFDVPEWNVISTGGVSRERSFAKERILVADNSKFDKMAFAKVADWTELTKVVTDREPSREWLREFERLRIECVYPGKEDGKSK